MRKLRNFYEKVTDFLFLMNILACSECAFLQSNPVAYVSYNYSIYSVTISFRSVMLIGFVMYLFMPLSRPFVSSEA